MKPKKKFGQHFMSDRNILLDMVHAGNVSKQDTVLEIGPGTGNLTALLAEHVKKVFAVEKDRDLIPLLQERFHRNTNVKIIYGDILNLLGNRTEKKTSLHRERLTQYKVIANIPYYLTGRLLRLLFEAQNRPSTMVLMIQKEVAKRICAKTSSPRRAGKESLLSISVKAYGMPEIIRIVPKGAFHPPPTVDSAILAINNISDRWFLDHKIEQKAFFLMLKQAFGQKRKTLKNSLKAQNIGKWENRRPESLTLEDWAIVYGYRETK